MATSGLNLLSIGTLYPPYAIGGYEAMWHDTVHALRDRGHRVRVLASDWRVENNGQPEDVDVSRMLQLYVDDLLDVRRREGARAVLARERANDAIVREAIRSVRPAAALLGPTGGLPLGTISRLADDGVPVVALIAEHWPLYAQRVDPWQRRLARRRLLASALASRNGLPPRFDRGQVERWVCASEYLRGEVLTTGVDPDRIVVVRAGPDTTRFTPASPRQWRGELLYAGRLHPDKGVEHAVRAVAELPGHRLSLAGAGDPRYARKLLAIAAALGVSDRVASLGEQRDGLPALYAACDAVVFPSTWDEPWGLVPLEAMATGRPVVATAVGGAGEYLRDGENAIVVPKSDASAIAAAVRRLAEDPQLRTRLIDGGRQTADGLSYSRFVDGVADAVVGTATG